VPTAFCDERTNSGYAKTGALLPSRPGELHPEPLTEPDLTLSRHPARAIARRLPPSIEHRAPPVAGWPAPMTMACSLRSTGITPLLSYYEAVRPSPAHRYFGLAVGAACAFSLTIAGQVLTFHTKAWSSFAPPTRRMPLGQSQDILRARPGRRVTPRFRHRLIRFRRFCSGSLALASLDRPCRDHRPDVSATFTTVAFDNSSLRWLGIGS
jgi:hypothetical protein